MRDSFVGKHVLVRSDESGVHFGVLKAISDDFKSVHLDNSRRVNYWEGAASCSELAAHGTQLPYNCRIEVPIEMIVYGCCEVILMSDEAIKNLYDVPVWQIKKAADV